MTKFANRLFHIPEYSDNESNVIARLTYNAAIGLALLSLVFVIISAFVAPALLERAVIMAFMVILTSFGVMVLIQNYKLQIASILQTSNTRSLQMLLKQALQRQAQYKSLLENIPATTYINSKDETAYTEYVSPQVEKLLGYPRNMFILDTLFWKKILHPEDYERVMNANHAVNMTG